MTEAIPLSFRDAIEKVAPRITRTNHVLVEVEDTPANNGRIETIAELYDKPFDTVLQAVAAQIEYNIDQYSPDEELDDHLIDEEQRGFMSTGD